MRTEITIIGAGITGALLAERLTAAGLRPLILERRRGALRGSTAASTALLQFELDVPLVHLAASIGERKAVQVWHASREAVNELHTRTHSLGLAAALETRPSLYLDGNVLDAKGLAREARLRQRHGLPSELLTRRALAHHFGIKRSAAILSHGNAEANPVALAAAYLSLAIRRGARLRAPHEVVDLHASRHGVELLTKDGRTILSRRVVFATGYEAPKIVPDIGQQIHATWALATKPQPQNCWPQRALIWEAADPYLYARTLADGRVLVGGEDEPMSADAAADEQDLKVGRLQAKLERLFPHVDARADFSWTGSFSATPNGMPAIGPIPGHRGCYCVMGYGGNGITFSMLAAQLLTQLLTRKRAPAAKLFEFPR